MMRSANGFVRSCGRRAGGVAHRGAPAAVCAVLVSLQAGCSSDPLAQWRDSVEHRVFDQGGGDLGALRGASPEGDRFDHIGRRAKFLEMFPSNRRDVYGVLLPAWREGDVVWQPMLVGVVRFSGVLDRFPLGRSRVEDIRLVAARTDGYDLEWKTTAADEDMLALYLGGSEQDGDATFPIDGDRVEVERVPGGLIAHERRSGSLWTLMLLDGVP